MSEALFNTYRMWKRPCVLYNGFSVNESSIYHYKKRMPNSLIWFSQVIGEGRGLETLLEALCLIEQPLIFNLIGKLDIDFEKVIRGKLINTKHQVVFHGVVKHKEIVPLISKYMIGLSLESNETLSRDTTVTNKILQYLQAGNKIIATKTQGQTELSNQMPGFIYLVNMNDPKEWAKAIIDLLNSEINSSITQVEKFNEMFSWESQEKKLLSLVNSTFFPTNV
jgi:glycosyltransferase involved in cell wall biosynthesis